MKINFSKIFKKVKVWIKSFNTFLQPFLNIISLGVAIVAVLISQKTLDNANLQFKINSKASDSLFNLQLKSSKELNDNLIDQIRELQKITNSQLKITDEQLKISVETLNEQIYSGRPKFVIMEELVADSNFVYDNIYSPKLIVNFKNIGKRFAYKFLFRPFVIFSDFSDLRHGIKPQDSLTVEPDGAIDQIFQPRIPLKYKSDFYFCYELSYFDNKLRQHFSQVYYKHYTKNRNSYGLFFCGDDEKKQIRKLVNVYLEQVKEPLFDE